MVTDYRFAIVVACPTASAIGGDHHVIPAWKPPARRSQAAPNPPSRCREERDRVTPTS